MKRKLSHWKSLLLLLLPLMLLASCKKESTDVPEAEAAIGEFKLNPYGFSPLTATLEVDVSRGDVLASVTVKAKDENDTDLKVEETLSPQDQTQYLPILGLYPDHTNEILIRLYDRMGNILKEIEDTLTTDPLPFELNEAPKVTGSIGSNEMIFTVLFTAFNLSSSGLGTLNYTQYAVLIDKNGNIRWYADFKGRSHSVLNLIVDYLYAGSSDGTHISELIKYNLLGEELEVHDFSMYGPRPGFENIHHEIRQTPDETFLLTVNGIDHPSVENFIIELDPFLSSNNIQTVIDLEEILPNVDDLFPDLPQSYYPDRTDAIHNNGIYPYPDGKNVLVSSQRCGLAKINLNTGSLLWYLFPHKVQAAAGFDKADYSSEPLYDENNYPMPHPSWRPPANGEFPSQDYQLTGAFNYDVFLLHPLDASGDTINSDEIVWHGLTMGDFTYPYRQHSPFVLENDNILVFDNGYMRDFGLAQPFYSRVVEYQVNEDNTDGYGGTVQQVWEYLPEDQYGFFCPTVGSVSELENGNRLLCFSSIGFSLSSNLTPEEMLALSQNTKAYIVEVTPDNPPLEIFSLTLNTRSIGMTASNAKKIEIK